MIVKMYVCFLFFLRDSAVLHTNGVADCHRGTQTHTVEKLKSRKEINLYNS